MFIELLLIISLLVLSPDLELHPNPKYAMGGSEMAGESLLSDPQFFDDILISFYVRLFKIIEESPPLPHQL